MTFTVLTVNVRGLRDPIKRAAVFSSLASMRGDIFILQEVHLRDEDDVRIFSQEWTGGPSGWSVGSVHSNGVGILFKGQAFSIEEVMTVVAGRIIVVDFSLASVRYRAINVYAPAQDGGRLEMFGEISACLCTTRTVILGGDFNVSLDGSGAGPGSESSWNGECSPWPFRHECESWRREKSPLLISSRRPGPSAQAFGQGRGAIWSVLERTRLALEATLTRWEFLQLGQTGVICIILECPLTVVGEGATDI